MGKAAGKPARTLYLWACERLYAELAWAYEWVAAGVSLGAWPAWRRLALPLVRAEGSTGRVLELGPGPGALLAELAAAGVPALGLERSAQMVEVARRGQAWRGAPPLAQGDARALPFADGSFDTLLATFPAPYILEQATLAEAARVLGPGGRLLVVGLWASAPRWQLRPAPSAGSSSSGQDGASLSATHAAADERLRAAGFAPRFWRQRVAHPLRVGYSVASVGMLEARRTPGAPHAR